jgi:hypothetical protein
MATVTREETIETRVALEAAKACSHGALQMLSCPGASSAN